MFYVFLCAKELALFVSKWHCGFFCLAYAVLESVFVRWLTGVREVVGCRCWFPAGVETVHYKIPTLLERHVGIL